MPIHNNDIARIFNDIADLLEIDGANQFRVRAYRTAAGAISGLSGSAAEMIDRGEDLTKISGIGDDLADKIKTITSTGSLPQLRKLQKRLPSGLRNVMAVAGLGPKKTAILYRELGIDDTEALRRAAEKKRIRELKGFGRKTEKNILEELRRSEERGEKRTMLAEAEEYAEALRRHLQEMEGVKRVVVAGSYRRRRDTVGDVDILVTCKRGVDIMDHFTSYDDVDTLVSRGKTRSTVILRSGLQVDLRSVPEVSYGAALHYFTGSKAHNIAIRKIGAGKGYKINEYGVFEDDERIAGGTEEEVYKSVGLPYIEPELREDRGEIEAAKEKSLPKLIELTDLRGDLHTHTKKTDGHDSLEEMARAAEKNGYDYLAVTDHSQRVHVAKGLDKERLSKQIDAIDELNDRLEKITLLKGSEVDILEDGSLDLPDDVLARLDIRICAIHSSFDLGRDEQTERVLRAMDNPHFNILAHPSGRLINKRRAYDIDMERIMQEAEERGCFLELNSQPERLDLSDNHLKRAKEIGVKIAISTDSHWARHLDWIRFGIYQARRGWLEAADIINSRGLDDLRKLLTR